MGVHRKPKLCFLTNSLSTGGIEMYLLRILRYLEQDNYDITVMVRSFKKGELERDYHSLGVKIIRQPLGYFHPGRMWKYYQLFRREKYDVICDFNANFAGIPMWLAKMAGVKKRVTFYRQGRDHFSPSFFRNVYNTWVNQLVYIHATHILSNSQAALDFFFPSRLPSDRRFKVIRNGLNIEVYTNETSKETARALLGLPAEAFIIGHVGRLDIAKNHETIIKVFEKVKKRVPEAHLLLCGRGTQKLMTQIEKLDLSKHSTIFEYRDDIPIVLRSLDVFLFPSLTEGQPNALIEAMAAGIPFVASNILAIKECVPGEYINHLFNPNDSDAMSRKLEEVFSASLPTDVLVGFVRSTFNAQKNFREFENVLINE